MTVDTSYHIPTRFCIGSICGSIAEFVNLPLDLVKVRMQLRGETVSKTVVTKRMNFLQVFKQVYREEGLKAFFAGGQTALARQLICNGMGIGFYKYIKDALYGKNVRNTFFQRVSVSMITGLYTQVFALPLDVIKVRMQADGRLKMQGLQPRYKSMLDACVTIPRAEGWRAFYIGALPTVVRTICMSVSGIACYDQSREIIKEFVGRDDTDSFFYRALYSSFASLISGTLSTLVSNPFDVVKTRMMSQRQGEELYRNSWDCFIKTLLYEGPFALLKGFSVVVLRFVPWQFVFYNTSELMARYLLNDTLTR